MEWWQALILGVVQGLTEFLPVSSSGHLIFVQELLGVQGSDEDLVAFDVALHAGTLLALFAYFREDLSNMARGWFTSLRTRKVETTDQRLAWLILFGTLPAILAYLLFEDQIDKAEDNLTLVATMLICFSFVFILVEWLGRKRRSIEDVKWWDALAIGCGQAFALIPGTSRSGATISTGLALGFKRDAAARFSFLLSTPVVTAALILTLPDLFAAGAEDTSFIVATFVGFVAAAISGYWAVSALLKFLGGHSLAWFALYRIPVGFLLLWYFETH